VWGRLTVLDTASSLDLASGMLTVRRGHQRRVIYLDEVTAALASQWLRYRHQRWPASRNPHPLVISRTTNDASDATQGWSRQVTAGAKRLPERGQVPS
jgi:hypothetical protein